MEITQQSVSDQKTPESDSDRTEELDLSKERHIFGSENAQFIDNESGMNINGQATVLSQDAPMASSNSPATAALEAHSMEAQLATSSTRESPAYANNDLKRTTPSDEPLKARKIKNAKKSSLKDSSRNSPSTSAAGTPHSGDREKQKKPRPKSKVKRDSTYLSPLRIRLPDFGDALANPRLPLFLLPSTASTISTLNTPELYFTDDHPFNRRGFRYLPCEPATDLSILKYRQIEIPPYGPRANYEDMSMHIMVDRETSTIVSTEKGFRSVRANVFVREGKWYWECRVLKGNRSAGDGNVRAGWTRREASLETPVGFDAYGYGIRDVTGQKMHISRPADFMGEPFEAGDVIGFFISLPSIKKQMSAIESERKSMAKSSDTQPEIVSNVVRDRIPIKYKGQLYFEQFECVPEKEFQDMLNQSSFDDVITRERSLRKKGLADSEIRVFKNGKFVGIPFDHLLPFLPPHSVPLSNLGARVTDDGALGYYPSISVYNGGIAQFNFGPEFDHFPRDLEPDASPSIKISKRVRPMCERYDEQIAEDIVWDVVDEVDLFLNDDDILDDTTT
ncbi:hypothetical protein V1512DRAFT_243447 [Lipomyces arxii]|uniref:uncharacterized protein n=1 Tax=Lipomyces arxii TaxID=56418 RepID=UPI0034CD4E49